MNEVKIMSILFYLPLTSALVFVSGGWMLGAATASHSENTILGTKILIPLGVFIVAMTMLWRVAWTVAARVKETEFAFKRITERIDRLEMMDNALAEELRSLNPSHDHEKSGPP